MQSERENLSTLRCTWPTHPVRDQVFRVEKFGDFLAVSYKILSEARDNDWYANMNQDLTIQWLQLYPAIWKQKLLFIESRIFFDTIMCIIRYLSKISQDSTNLFKKFCQESSWNLCCTRDAFDTLTNDVDVRNDFYSIEGNITLNREWNSLFQDETRIKYYVSNENSFPISLEYNDVI